MNMPSRRVLIGAAVAVLLLSILIAFGFWSTNPQRTVDAFLQSVHSHNTTAAMNLVSVDISTKKRNNIQSFVDDWSDAKTMTWVKGTSESWRTHVKGHNADGSEQLLTIPASKYLAHNHQELVTVTAEDKDEPGQYKDPVIIVLERNTKDAASLLGQIFRGWKIVQIKSQILDASDFTQAASVAK